ncbi:MAG: hypothetical protein F4077_03510 [Gammaproteobacteria bacterium]|nr:hypothetical protein [Gammaproteobacteria bacterium]
MINVIDQVTVEKESQRPFPNEQHSKGLVVPLTADFVIHSEREKIDQSEIRDGRILIKGPDEEEIDQIDFDVDLTQHMRSRNVVQFSVFPFVGAGLYRLEVLYSDVDSGEFKLVDSVPLELVVAENVSPESSP